ncbi:MAG: CCA tRNA nucleotidyltransferase [Planctomycetaceae bacterium]
MFDFIPPPAAQALAVIEKIQAAGFIAYLAGGCVRDALLQKQPKDFDVATDATPEMVRKIFGQRRTLAFGASFGVIGVLGDAPLPTEVATFRSDGEYSDGRRPDSVRFGTAEHDALRRDFTINGMFFDPVADRLIDYVGGEADLRQRIVRAIGDPAKRISEDKLRMLRALRIASSLGFALDPETLAALRQFASQVTVVSAERIGAEMRRMLGDGNAVDAIQLLFDTHLIEHVWPSFAAAARTDSQLLADSKRLVDCISPPSFVVAVAVMLSRTQCDLSTTLGEIATVWKLSCDEQRAIVEAVRHRETIAQADQAPWSSVQPIVAGRDAATIISAAASWAEAFGQSKQGITLCQAQAALPREQLDPRPLLTGDTLRSLGFTPGPRFRDVLQSIRNAQLDQEITTQSAAIELARSLLA